MSKTVRHPATQRLIDDVTKRWFIARKAQDAAADRMWQGMLLGAFTTPERALLRELDYFSPRDEALIEAGSR